MTSRFKTMSLAIATLLLSGVAMAQLPVEVFVGQQKVTADMLFFKFFKNRKGQHSNWLFFNRNRASIDYKMTTTANLPQFGFTEAISYNNKQWKGFAPVAVVQLLNRGVYPKMGIQFAKTHKAYTVFTWVVCETLKKPSIDWFFLGRYTPPLTSKLRLFTQIELVNAFPTSVANSFNFIQRLRLGISMQQYQLGVGADFTALGRNDFITTQNVGAFLRCEF
jgi:hypothetical protein